MTSLIELRKVSCDIINTYMNRVCKVNQRLEKKRIKEKMMLLKIRDKLRDDVK